MKSSIKCLQIPIFLLYFLKDGNNTNSFIFISIKLFISLIAISYYIQKNNNGFLDIKHVKCFSNTFQLLRTLLTVVNGRHIFIHEECAINDNEKNKIITNITLNFLSLQDKCIYSIMQLMKNVFYLVETTTMLKQCKTNWF